MPSENGTLVVYVHDGRAGRDPARVDPDGNGELLMTVYPEAVPDLLKYEIGHVLQLPDGTACVVIGVAESIGDAARTWTRRVAVGNC